LGLHNTYNGPALERATLSPTRVEVFEVYRPLARRQEFTGQKLTFSLAVNLAPFTPLAASATDGRIVVLSLAGQVPDDRSFRQ
jgi:hypothetical protein